MTPHGLSGIDTFFLFILSVIFVVGFFYIMNKDAVIREPGKGLTDGMIDLPAEYVILIAKYNNKVDIFRNINENHINKLSNMDYLSKASIDSKLTKTGHKKAVEIKKRNNE